MPNDPTRRTEKDRRRIQRKLDQEIRKLEFLFDPAALSLTGPIITTNIGLTQSHADAITATGASVPPSASCRFLVDTGADVCVVKHEFAATAADFDSGTVCLATQRIARDARDGSTPPAGEVLFYLARATDACPGGTGTLGFRSSGSERVGRSCP